MTQATFGNPVTNDNGTVINAVLPLFKGQAPVNGFSVLNADPTNDLWICEGGQAAVNTAGSIRCAANGGGYESPAHHAYKPNGTITIIGAGGATPVQYTARSW